MLVISLARDKQLESVRTYAVSADILDMTYIAAYFFYYVLPFVLFFLFSLFCNYFLPTPLRLPSFSPFLSATLSLIHNIYLSILSAQRGV